MNGMREVPERTPGRGERRVHGSTLAVTAGALAYLVLQSVISPIRDDPWGAPGILGAKYGLLFLSLAVLLGARRWPERFAPCLLGPVLSPLCGIVMAAALGISLVTPYMVVREVEWLGPASYRTMLHPLLPACFNVLLFLTALGHLMLPRPRRIQVLLRVAPLLVVIALLLMLHVSGYPEFRG